MFSIILW